MRIIPFLLFLTGAALAETPRSSVSLATGGGGVASIEVGEASFLNPASLVHLRDRHFFSSFQDDLFALSLSENSPDSALPGALSYFKQGKTEMFSLSLADFAYKNISFGITGSFWQARGRLDEKARSTLNANIGLVWTLSDRLGIGFVAENVLSTPDSFTSRRPLIPASRFGLNYVAFEWFRCRVDFVTVKNNQWKEWLPQAGFESYLGRWLIARAGVNLPRGQSANWSAGLGLDLPRFKINYASRWKTETANGNLHSVDFEVPF